MRAFLLIGLDGHIHGPVSPPDGRSEEQIQADLAKMTADGRHSVMEVIIEFPAEEIPEVAETTADKAILMSFGSQNTLMN
jgi:hypothetical protein